MQRCDRHAPTTLLDAVAAQASRHHEGMSALLDLSIELYAAHVARTGRHPPRGHDAARLMAWVERGVENEDDLALLCPAPWEAPPWPALRTPEITITPIHTQRALFDEGLAMHHCVASYGTALAAGRAFLYHLEHASGPSTMLLVRPPGERVRLREHRGPFNREVGHEVAALVERWVSSLDAGAAPAPSSR